VRPSDLLRSFFDEEGSEVPRTRILLADTYPELLEVISELLREEFDIIGKTNSGSSVLRDAEELEPDIIVLDLALADMTAFEVIRALKQKASPAKILVLSVYESQDFVRAACDAGASGYVFKFLAATDLREAILALNRGETFFPCASNGTIH
jgi:DNA-binding NarL/FixJ family response regulator